MLALGSIGVVPISTTGPVDPLCETTWTDRLFVTLANSLMCRNNWKVASVGVIVQ